MTVKDLIERLRCFDEDHHIKIEAFCDCSMAVAGNTVDKVEFKGGDVVLTSEEY